MSVAIHSSDPPGRETRRGFLHRAAGYLLTGAFVGQAAALVRALWPDVLYEPSPRFKLGAGKEFGEGLTYIDSRRLFVWRKGNDFYAMSAVCTHLGCTVKPAAGAGGAAEFHCPCHGSRYREDGTNYSGPAPRPLDRYRIEVAPDDGQILVDSSATVDRNFRLKVQS